MQKGDIELVQVAWVLSCKEPHVRFEISTFKTGYRQNFVKIRKLILFGQKCPNLGTWVKNFGKQMTDLKSAPSKYVTSKMPLKD